MPLPSINGPSADENPFARHPGDEAPPDHANQSVRDQEKGGTAEPFLYERTLGSRDVLVKITHRSLARGDIQYIDNAWGDTRFPLVPGHEIVGIVEEAGSEVTDLQTGDRVGIGYQQEACFECSFCRQGIEQLCASQKVIAVDCYGGLAEHIVVDGRFAFQLSPQLDSATSAPLALVRPDRICGDFSRRDCLPALEWRCWAQEGSAIWQSSSSTGWGTA